MSSLRTAFIGLTHIGQVTSICWASLGNNVYAIDPDKKLIKKLTSENFDTSETQLLELYKKNKTKIKFSDDLRVLSKCNLIFYTLDLPTTENFNTKELDNLIKKSLQFIQKNSTLIIISQIPPGYCRKTLKKIQKNYPYLNIKLYHWVNTLIIGESIDRFINPERIIIGGDNSKNSYTAELNQALSYFNAPVFHMNYESAELTKSAINLFLASSITTANTIADLCEVTGADYNQIIPALKSDKRIGKYAYINPTIRISGGHLEREIIKLKSLSKSFKIKPLFLNTLNNLNEDRINWIIDKIKIYLKDSKNNQICIWGLSYKKDTSSTDNAVSLKLIQKLNKKYKITVYDPKANIPNQISGYKRYKNKFHALENSSCLIILTPWDEFKDADLQFIKSKMVNPIIIDCVNILIDKKPHMHNLVYLSLGKAGCLNKWN